MQRLIYSLSGQVLTHVPDVRRASATWALEDLRHDVDSASRILASGSSNVDATSTTTTAAVGPDQDDPRGGPVASSAGFVVGGTYEMVAANAAGDRELVTVAGAPSGALRFEHPLIGEYPTGSTIRGITLTTGAIPTPVVSDENRVQADWPMRLVWTYPDGSRAQEGVRLVREDRSDQLVAQVTSDVRDLFPDLDTRMQRHGRDTLAPTVRLVLRIFRADMLGRGLLVEQVLAGDKGRWCLVWRTLWHLARLGNAPQAEIGATFGGSATDWSEYCKGEYERAWHSLTIGEGGPEVLVIEPMSSTAPASHDTTYRLVIGEL